jgi:hypothetical protein
VPASASVVGSDAPTTWHPALCLQVKGGDARVHWLYLPDSYDEWIPAAAAPAPGAEPQRKPPRGPWRVYVRWLTDSERYNEWMNPADYETAESAEAEGKRKREGEEEEPARKVGAGAGGGWGWWQVGVAGNGRLPWLCRSSVDLPAGNSCSTRVHCLFHLLLLRRPRLRGRRDPSLRSRQGRGRRWPRV